MFLITARAALSCAAFWTMAASHSSLATMRSGGPSSGPGAGAPWKRSVGRQFSLPKNSLFGVKPVLLWRDWLYNHAAVSTALTQSSSPSALRFRIRDHNVR